MMSRETLTRAWEVLQDAYQAQMEGDYERAVELYQASLDLHPTAEAHTFLGWTYHFQGKLDEAIPWLEQATEALRYEPRHFPHYNLGRAYLGREMYARAITCFQQALQVEPRYSAARQALESLRRMVN